MMWTTKEITEIFNGPPVKLPPPALSNPEIVCWKGVTVVKADGTKREFNVRCTFQHYSQCTHMRFDQPITTMNGETVTIGEPFAEEEDDNPPRRRN